MIKCLVIHGQRRMRQFFIASTLLTKCSAESNCYDSENILQDEERVSHVASVGRLVSLQLVLMLFKDLLLRRCISIDLDILLYVTETYIAKAS